MKRIQNLLAIVTVGLIGISVFSFAISALCALIGAETAVGLFGYIGVYSGLIMLLTGSAMSIMFIFEIVHGCLHHSDSTATHGMV